MPGSTGPNLGLVWGFAQHENGWGDTGYNPGFAKLDTLTQLAVLDITNTPPSTPGNGDRYIVGTTPLSAFAGHQNSIAVYLTTGTPGWQFYVPKQGWQAYNINTDSYYYYDGTVWDVVPSSPVAPSTTFINGGVWSPTSSYLANTFVKRLGVWYINNAAIAAPSATFGFEGLATLSSTAAVPTVNITTVNVPDEILVIAALPHDANSITSITSTHGLVFTRRARIARNILGGFRVALEMWAAPAGRALTAETLTIVTDAGGSFSTSCRYIAVGVTGARVSTGPFDSNVALPATASGDATPVSVNITTSTAGDRLLFISANTNDGAHTPNSTPPTGFTQLSFLGISGTTTNNTQLNVCYEDVSATQSALAVASSESPSCWVAIGGALVRAAENAEPLIDPRWIKVSSFTSADFDDIFGTTIGTLITRKADGTWGVISPGSATQILTSNGSAAPATFQPPASGVTGGLFANLLSLLPTQSNTGLSTWVNQGSATIVDNAAGISIACVSNGTAQNYRGVSKSQPATPYIITALLTLIPATMSGAGSTASVFIGFYDGTKLHAIELQQNGGTIPRLVVNHMNTVAGSGIVGDFTGGSILTHREWVRLRNDGSTLLFQWAKDGVNFRTYYSIAIGTTLTPTRIIFGINPYATDATGSLNSYLEA